MAECIHDALIASDDGFLCFRCRKPFEKREIDLREWGYCSQVGAILKKESSPEGRFLVMYGRDGEKLRYPVSLD